MTYVKTGTPLQTLVQISTKLHKLLQVSSYRLRSNSNPWLVAKSSVSVSINCPSLLFNMKTFPLLPAVTATFPSIFRVKSGQGLRNVFTRSPVNPKGKLEISIHDSDWGASSLDQFITRDPCYARRVRLKHVGWHL